MAGIAHGWHPTGMAHPPSMAVAQEFNAADRGSPMLSQAMQKQRAQAMALRGQGPRPQGGGMPMRRAAGPQGY